MNELDKVGFNVGEVLILEDDDLLTESTPVITGKFRRGRIDQHMLITKQNIRAKLGHDPRNIYYNNVCDALENIPAVYVMRIFEGNQILPELPFGKWIISPNVTINYATGTAHYTAHKTNGYSYYDSHADIDLTNAIINSFGDTDMQQWQAFKDAVNELTGVTDWVVDSENNRITYHPKSDPATNPDPSEPFFYQCKSNASVIPTKYYSAVAACSAFLEPLIASKTDPTRWIYTVTGDVKCGESMCYIPYDFKDLRKNPPEVLTDQLEYAGLVITANPIYDPAAEAERDKKTLPLTTVAAQVISNASSNNNQGTSLLAETYIQEIAKSIFNENAAKKFVNLNDLINEFEKNKVVRSIF